MKRSMITDQGCEWIFHGVGTIYMKNERYKQAVNIFNKIIKSNDSYPEAYVQLGIISKIEGRMEEAGNLFKKAICEQFNCEAAHYQLGLLYLEEGQYDLAIDCFSEVLKRNPANTDVILNLVIIDILQDEFDRAGRVLEKVCVRNAVTPDSIVKLLPHLISKEQFDMAFRLINPANMSGHGYDLHSLVKLLSSIGVVEITTTFAERLVEKWGDMNAEFGFRPGKLLAERLLGSDEWISEWKKYPEWFPVHKIGLDEALTVLQRWGAFVEAVEVCRTNDFGYSSTKIILFNILFRLGRYHEALMLSREIAFKPYLRAVILRNMGRVREAKKELKICQNSMPSSEFIYQMAFMEFFDLDVKSTILASNYRDTFRDFQRIVLESFSAEAADDDEKLVELADLLYVKNIPTIITPLLSAALFREGRQSEGNALLHKTLVNIPLNRIVDPYRRHAMFQSSPYSNILGDHKLCDHWIFTMYDASDRSLQSQYLLMRMRYPEAPHNVVLELAHKAVQPAFQDWMT